MNPLHSPEADGRHRAPPAVPEGPLRRRELAAWSDADLERALRHGSLTRLAHGIYDAGGHQLPPMVAKLQALTADADVVASHETAAALLGLWGTQLREPFHLTVPRRRTRIRRRGVVGHGVDIPAGQITSVAGVRVTTAARTWADRFAGGSLEDALIAADLVLRAPRVELEGPGEAAATRHQLQAVVESMGGRRGVAMLRQAAELARERVDSPQETRLRLALHRAGLPEPEVNEWVLDEYGRPAFQPDLMFREWKVAVQYEGAHHSLPQQVERDVGRAELATALGWIEARITRRHQVRAWEPAVDKVTAALMSRGWRP
ncbi:type IV toxin-antitoxin system AbiEi family antitoxin domain-containing protein [Nesterenkonia sp. PF2B19]|uniref:type IV toxin-antitoxin system AbiEi family antitoxin domain-containing protein n=1 Tax=unclassified Nesterenkonia TaxID=2629769 RepID=UPI000AFBE787|nr:type IV toxin-antitoxin system AbiEi family antitoxin domain-containing protein [Nesterenkonia sp. PF2B19]